MKSIFDDRWPILILLVAITPRIILWWVHTSYGFALQPLGTLNIYTDFERLYSHQLAYLAQGYLPYLDIPYSSPPLFLYSLFPFYESGGPAAASAFIVIADSLAAVFVYLIAEKASPRPVAIVAALGYALSPLALYFEGYLWFNSEPAVLFVLVSIYLFQRGKWDLSALAFGIAVLFKQDALFILPVIAYMHLRVRGGNRLRSISIFLGTLLIGSLPFLLLAPSPYLKSVSYGLLGSYSPLLQLYPATFVSSTIPATCSQVVHLLKVTQTCTGGAFTTPAVQGQSVLGLLTLFSDWFGPFVILSLAALLLPAVFVARRWENAYLLASVYSSVLFLALFSFEVHSVVRYYLLLPYALFLTSSINWRTSAVPIAAMIISVFTPEGNFQLILILCALLAFIVLQDTSGSKVRPTRYLEVKDEWHRNTTTGIFRQVSKRENR